ncbi:MAG TPA: DUF799 family lipoprotein [Burkholderiaceae bacterium]|nr:DUF799 family lipoprotein [Burkholderiaceae bacterium]
MNALFRWLRRAAAALPLAGLWGCAIQPVEPFDYAPFRAARPASVLVLPPINRSSDIAAPAAVWAQAAWPLAEAGYYVLPATLVAETFRNNGLTVAEDVHQVAPAKLREIFGADAALSLTITRYGVVYTLFDSQVVVSVQARLLDLRSGQELWTGQATASDAGQNNQGGGGLLAAVIAAAVKQVVNNLSDRSFPVAGLATRQLFQPGPPRGVLYGPRSPLYGREDEKPGK